MISIHSYLMIVFIYSVHSMGTHGKMACIIFDEHITRDGSGFPEFKAITLKIDLIKYQKIT